MEAEKAKQTLKTCLVRGSACSKEEPFWKMRSTDSFFNFITALDMKINTPKQYHYNS